MPENNQNEAHTNKLLNLKSNTILIGASHSLRTINHKSQTFFNKNNISSYKNMTFKSWYTKKILFIIILLLLKLQIIIFLALKGTKQIKK